MGLVGMVVGRRRNALLCIALSLAFGFTSCGGGGGGGGGGVVGGGGGGTNVTPAGNYQISVVATAGTLVRQVQVPITVQ